MCYFKCALFLIVITIIGISDSTNSEKSSSTLSRASLAESSESLRRVRIKRKSFLSEAELKGQLELAKVNGLKKRFKRFSCWHSCFGELYKAVDLTEGEQDSTQNNSSFVGVDAHSPEMYDTVLAQPGARKKKMKSTKNDHDPTGDKEDKNLKMELPNVKSSDESQEPAQRSQIASLSNKVKRATLADAYDYNNPDGDFHGFQKPIKIT